ncbi:MAG: transposase [Bacteroidales bacterium]|nr:transposase [Bacteroidales bacterium]
MQAINDRCEHTADKEHTNSKEPINEVKYRLADFVNLNWTKYLLNPKEFIKPEHFKAINAIRTCGTEVLGKHIYACPSCGDISEITNSCKHRFCPSCSWKETLIWAEKAYLKLLNIPHRHAVATLPHALNSLLKKNYKLLNNALFKASAEALKDWMYARFKIIPGIMSVLHTAGEKKTQHHHTHMIVSMGGINKKTGELKTAAIKFIPYKFISRKFRIKFEDILVKLFDTGKLKHNFKNRAELLVLLKKINKDNWRFHFEPPMEDLRKVIRYVGRYSKRACLSESKITKINREYISFRYKDNRDRGQDNKPKEKILTLHYSVFFPRLLQHVPPPYYQIVRYYGLYANSNKIKKEYTAKPSSAVDKSQKTYKDPKHCEYCDIAKKHIYSVQDIREPKKRTEKFNKNKHKCLITYPLKIA